ncbi:hypothetical protein, conserved [Leishmania lindenbergi]|uniref:Uncharacterized protein n=1 Tax=Leishmania lindenbergi TaxID=651832 RepID=A0AAW3A1M4_9TRYP
MPSESHRRTSSVHTSSSHRSIIEVRGVPEFDREYARQLSIAKRGRNDSVKKSQPSAPVPESLPENQLYDSAALAASRIKDYVVTHVTPPRIPHLSSSSRTSEHGGKSIGSSKAEMAREHTSPVLPAPTTGEEVEGCSVSLPLTSTRRGSSFDDTEAPMAAAINEGENLLLFLAKQALVIGAVFFAVLCAAAFVVSSSADYNPSYFTFTGASLTPRPRMRDAALARRGWLNRLVPEFPRQAALHIRRALWHVLSYIGVPGVFRSIGSMLVVPKAYIWDPAQAMLPRMDQRVHPALRYIFSNVKESGEEWGLATVTTLAASVARSLVQLVVEPLVIVSRTMQALYRWVGGPTAFAATLKPLHVTSGNTSSAVAAAKANCIPIPTRAASTALLSLWRPLHSLWGVFMSAASSLADTSAPRNESTLTARITNASTPPDRSTPSPMIEKTPPSTLVDVTPPVVAAHVEVQTAHTHRLEGALWPSFLDTHRHEMESLARDDVWELLRGDGDATREVEVALRAGSLVMDIAIVSQTTVRNSLQPAGGDIEKATGDPETRRRARRAAIDAQLQQWHFPRLRAFYNRTESSAEAQRACSASATTAAAACEGRLTECQQQSVSIRREVERELHSCMSNARKLKQSCAAASEEAAKEMSAQLRKRSDELTNCLASLSKSTADLAEQERRAGLLERESHKSQVALAAARQAVAGAAVVSAGSLSNPEAVQQQCTASLVTAVKECEQRVHDTRCSSDAEHAKQLAFLKEECANQRSAMEKALMEKAKLAVLQAEAECSEQLNKKVAAFNKSAASALVHHQEALAAAKAEAEKRVAACADAAEQARVSFSAEQAQLNASCAAQLLSIRLQCETAERCAAKQATLGEDARRASIAAVQKAEAACMVRLSRDLSTFNSSATTAKWQLQQELKAARREALRGATACEKSKRQTEAECGMAQKRLREECDAQLRKARKSSTAVAQQARAEERETQQRILANRWRLEVERIAAQCATTTQAAVNEASQLLTEKHAKAQEEAVIEERRRIATQLLQKEKVCRIQSEAVLKLHQGQLRDLDGRLAICTAQFQAAEEAHQQAVQRERQTFHTAVADSAKEACLEVTQRDVNACADVRMAVEEELHRLPVNASITDAFTRMLKSTVEPGGLTWKFSGASVHALKGGKIAAAGGRQARFLPSLRVLGMLFGAVAFAYVLAKCPLGCSLSDVIIACLAALRAANEATMPLRLPTLRSRLRRCRSRHCGGLLANGEAPLTWDVVGACMANSSEALLAWHSACCTILLKQDTHDLRGRQHQGNGCQATPATDAFTPLSERELDGALALSASHSAPGVSLVSAPTFPITHEDAGWLSQLHATFVNGYYNMLEMYYMDLLSSVANRELAESQLQEVESVATRQAIELQKQSAVVEQLKESLADKERLPNTSIIEDSLVKAERRAAAQEETIALLEKQLKTCRDELDRARGVVHTPVPSLCILVEDAVVTGPESSASQQVHSLQELADGSADGDSINASNFSNLESGLVPHRDATPPLPVSSLGNPVFPSATKKSTMVRNPDSTRRYHRLRWDDDVDLM